MKTVILVFTNSGVRKYDEDTGLANEFKWHEWFSHHEDLQYLEIRIDGKKHREYTRMNYYKHLAGEVE